MQVLFPLIYRLTIHLASVSLGLLQVAVLRLTIMTTAHKALTARDRRKAENAAKLDAAIKDAARGWPCTQRKIREGLAAGKLTWKRGHIYLTI
jgi:hypothetical protein